MNKEQFISLIEQEQESLRRFLCVLCGGDSFRADDIAQDALLKAYISFEKFEGRSKFSTWLFRIAYNCFYDYRARSAKHEGEPLSNAFDNRVDDGGTEPDARFAYQDLYSAIGELSEAERDVILLFYMEDRSIKDIEAITGMPSGTIRSHLSRGRKQLKKYLKNTR